MHKQISPSFREVWVSLANKYCWDSETGQNLFYWTLLFSFINSICKSYKLHTSLNYFSFIYFCCYYISNVLNKHLLLLFSKSIWVKFKVYYISHHHSTAELSFSQIFSFFERNQKMVSLCICTVFCHLKCLYIIVHLSIIFTFIYCLHSSGAAQSIILTEATLISPVAV